METKKVKPLFELHADATLDKVRAIYADRGVSYSDTWRTCRFLNMRAVAKQLGLAIDERFLRALCAAAFVDMKQERMSGGWKEDSMIDGIAYEALLIGEMGALTNPTCATVENKTPYSDHFYKCGACGRDVEMGVRCFCFPHQ